MKTDLHHLFALSILLVLPAAATQCSSTFTENIIDLHEFQPQATTDVRRFSDGNIQGNSVDISSLLPSVSLNDINSVDDFGCNADIENAYVFKLRLMRGDTARFYILNEEYLQIREIKRSCSKLVCVVCIAYRLSLNFINFDI